MEGDEIVSKRAAYSRVKAAERRRAKMDLACQNVDVWLNKVELPSIIAGGGLSGEDVRALYEVLQLVEGEVGKNQRLTPIHERVKTALKIAEAGSGVMFNRRVDYRPAQKERAEEREHRRVLARERDRAYYERNQDEILARRRAARQAKKGESR